MKSDEERIKIAESLFDGDKEKAEKLLMLMDNIIPMTPSFENLVMNIPQEE